MKYWRTTLSILVTLTVLISLITLVVVGHAFYLRGSAAPAAVPATSVDTNPYQIVTVNDQAFRIDTRTGKVWVYTGEGGEGLPLEYLPEHGHTSLTQDRMDQLWAQGWLFTLAAHWKEIPEKEAVERRGDIMLIPVPPHKQLKGD